MSSNPVRERSRHREQRMFLMELEATIEDLGADVYKLDATQLKKLNVNLCDMTLDPNSEFNPRFFASRLNLPQPSDEILDEACSPISRGYDDSYLDAYSTHIYWNLYALHNIAFEDGSPWRLKCPGEYTPYKHIYQYDNPEFGAFATTDIAGGEYPHFKAVIYNDLEADHETCFRGEILIALRLMVGQLRKIRLLHHNMAPVLLISLAGKRVRVLESYFDEETKSLILRRSELLELCDWNAISNAYKTLAAYYLGGPAGITV